MPLFTYVCKKCEQESEILVRCSEDPVCPQCGSKRLVKQASRFAAPKVSGGRERGSAFCGEMPCCSRRDGSCPVG